MKLPVEWLRDYVDFACSTDELANALTMAGLEVEDVIHYTPEQLARLGGGAEPPAGPVFDVKVTPNRGDWLSIIGVAREVSAILRTGFRLMDPVAKGTPPPTSSAIEITVEAPDLCRRYAAGLVRGVKIKESPVWMKNRLIMADLRPINNIVDITNYVLIEYGQPLHAFDYSLLRGPQIVVRRARPGETITTIDGRERALKPDNLVIADRDRAVAIGGVMGGSETEVNAATTDVLIESANFDPVSIRRTSKGLGLSSESSYRFERNVDPSITVTALKRAAELMRDLAAGEIAEGVVDVYPRKIEAVTLTLRPERANKLLGSDIGGAEMARILESLGMSVDRSDGAMRVTAPTFRADITQEVDLIEEVARLNGFDKIGVTLPLSRTMQGREEAGGRFESRVSELLMRCGGQEVATHTLVDPLMSEIAGQADQAVVIRNPLSEDLSRLRTALAPNLLQVLSRNASFGAKDLSVFEIGRVYRLDKDGEIAHIKSVAGAMVGTQWRSAWNLDKSAMAADFYLCKGVVETLMDALRIDEREFAPIQAPLLHPTRAAVVRSAGVELGVIGEVAESVCDALDLRGRPCVFELNLETLRAPAVSRRAYRPAARYPALYLDLSIVVDEGRPYADVRDLVQEVGGELVDRVELQEVYLGPQLAQGKKSLLLSIAFRSADRTLTDEMVNDVSGRIKDELATKLSAAIRGG